MSTPMTFTYTLYHVFLLKLLISFSFADKRTLHNFLFLAKVTSGTVKPRLAYDFYKSRLGAYSFEVDSHLQDLSKSNLITEDTLVPSKEGREFYYQVASLLRYEFFPDHCTRVASGYEDKMWRVNHEVFFQPYFRKARLGRKITS